MDWKTVESDVAKLAAQITAKPDSIVALARGGLVPARLLASRLDVSRMYCLTVVKAGTERRVVTEITERITGTTVLLVEDMLESGASLLTAKQYLESLGARVKTAALYRQPGSVVIPDYCLGELAVAPIFPWE